MVFFAVVATISNAFAETKPIHLSCVAKVTTDMNGAQKNVYEDRFDLKIVEQGSNFSIESSSSHIGITIFLNTQHPFRYSNIKNYSDESRWYFQFKIIQPNGDFFSDEMFEINRYSGAFHASSRSIPIFGEAYGKCESQLVKRF